ncbi:MAG: amino acid dehydrogenase [Cohaesibacter sp.]|nr:amino acid dehydrogenase [Cohaesibacter sp.]MCV6603359.1 amino acid dehydrogenase [Cohaesibacter sp.]
MTLIPETFDMAVTFDHPEFDDHEQVLFCADKKNGLKAIIAVHNTNLGPAIGGCRMWPYDSSLEALTDALRLSRGMTYKNALAGLAHGGGKSVIIADPHKDKSPQLIEAFARHVKCLAETYITAEDVGITAQDAEHMAQIAPNISGTSNRGLGDPSPYTALGTYHGIKAAAAHQFGTSDLKGLRISIQGLGNVGFRLAKHLHEEGAILIVSDVHKPNLDKAINAFDATMCAPDQAHEVECDIFAPCALGAGLNTRTIPQIKAKIVAGAANNQLLSAKHDAALKEAGILYAPDYVTNAGGVIAVAMAENTPQTRQEATDKSVAIGETLRQIFQKAEATNQPTGLIADQMAQDIFAR